MNDLLILILGTYIVAIALFAALAWVVAGIK